MIAVVVLLCFLVNTSFTQAKCVSPTAIPTVSPTETPSTIAPSISRKPTARPTTRSPTFSPSFIPTEIPTTASPSTQPTYSPSFRPGDPTPQPSVPPTLQPTVTPSYQPSRLPTVVPTRRPSCVPTAIPTATPTFSLAPTFAPTAVPSAAPTFVPSYVPSRIPTFSPTLAVTAPTFDPTADPTARPTFTITASPSARPTPLPTFAPSVSPRPSALPTSTPTATPTAHPTAFPTFTFRPTSIPTTATPSVFPTFSPTVTPSTHFPTAPLRTLLSMDLEVTLNNVDLDILSTNSSAQLAFETAVAMSVPFMEASQVSYLYSQSAGSTTSRHLRAVAITSLTNAVVGFNLLFYIEYFGYASANEASSSIQSLLSSAISSGLFIKNLNTAAARYGTSVVFTTSSASNLKVLRSSVHHAGGNDNNLYVDWPLYAKILLPIGVFIVVFICVGALVAYNQHYHVLELEFIGPAVSSNLRRFRGKKDKEISSPSAAAGVEAQFANLMLSEEYQTHSDTDPILVTDNPVKSPPVSPSFDAVSTSNPALKSAKSILKKGGDSSGKKTETAAVQSVPGTVTSSEDVVLAERISPGAIAMMPIVPKRQDFVSALFRRPTTTSKKDKAKQSKKPNNQKEKSFTDPPLDSEETIGEGADDASSNAVVTTEVVDAPEATQQPVDTESTLPPNDLDGQNSAANEGIAASSNDTHAPPEPPPVAKRPGFFSFF